MGTSSSRLRVLLLADELQPHGGSERSQVEVAEGLAARGHEISLLYARPGPFLDRYTGFARTTRRLPATQDDGRRRTDALLAAGAARAAVLARRCDVVYANSLRLSLLGAALRAVTGRPLVSHLRLPQPPPPTKKTRWAAASVDRFIAVSEHTRGNHVAAGVPASSIDVVHNGIDARRFPASTAEDRRRARAELGLAEDAFVALYAGRLDREKGLEPLLEAWASVAAPGDALLVAGAARHHESPAAAAAYEHSLRQAAPSSVRWLGRRLDVVPLYAASDVVVLPSLFEEPFGRVVVEGLATGRPVVATCNGGVPEVLGGFPELLVPPGDAPALAAAVGRLRGWQQRDPDLAQRLRGHVERSFTVDRTVAGIERVLVETVERGRQAPSTVR